MNSSMTEEKLLQYLRCHQGLQHIGVVANANRCSVARVLELSMDLRKKGLIEIRAYESGFHLQMLGVCPAAGARNTRSRIPRPA
jgi:hypothetical protein